MQKPHRAPPPEVILAPRGCLAGELGRNAEAAFRDIYHSYDSFMVGAALRTRLWAR